MMPEIDFTDVFDDGSMDLAVDHLDVKHIIRCEASHAYIVYTYVTYIY